MIPFCNPTSILDIIQIGLALFLGIMIGKELKSKEK